MDKPKLCSLDINMDTIGQQYRIQSLDIIGYLWITLWDNETGYRDHMRILKDTDKDIYGYIKVMQVGYN